MRTALLFVAIAATACSKYTAPDAPPLAVETPPASATVPVLVPLWVAEGFSDPEGVALAPDGTYFISNVAGGDIDEDGAGWISKLSADGAVLVDRWADNLAAPKGMAVAGGVLYVADIDRVRTFDAASGAPAATIPIDGAKFLNDATVWGGEVFVSDSGTARIWRLSAAGPVVWREGPELSGVNGLLGAGDLMFVSTMTSGSLYEAKSDGGWREIANGMKDADGIGVVPGGGWLVSSWPGEIYHVSADGAVKSVLNTRDEGVLQNDLTTFGDVVIVPNWEPGTVTAWRLEE